MFYFNHIGKKKCCANQQKKEKQNYAQQLKKFHDELLHVVKIQDKMEKIYPINEQQTFEIDKLYNEIWKFGKRIKTLEILLGKSSTVEEGRLLIEAIKEKTKGLQAELECNQDLITQEESKTFEFFSGLSNKRLGTLYKLDLKTRKLVKLGVSQTEIYAVKESNNLGQSSWWWN